MYGEAENDFSGISLSLSSDGSFIAIGAHANDGSGVDAGQVRIFENQSGTWVQVGQDIDGEAAGDKSGYSVSISSDGSVVAIGSYYNSDNGTEAGQVRVFELLSGTWTQIGDDIDGEAEVDLFGYSVSLSSDGSILAAGANANDVAGFDAGNVRVFENQDGTWTQIGENINGKASEDRFGNAVSLSSNGTVVAVGAPSNGASPGQICVFENQDGTWTQIGEDINGDIAGDMAGKRISLSSDGLVVAFGAVLNDNNGSNAGFVRVYKNQNGTWFQMGEDINGETANEMEGTSLCLNTDGSIIAVGAPFNSEGANNAGQVHVFQNLTVSTTSINKNDVITYPNPTNGKFILHSEDNIQEVSVTDISGKSIAFSYTITAGENHSIDISNQPNGVYFIIIHSKNTVVIKDIIKL